MACASCREQSGRVLKCYRRARRKEAKTRARLKAGELGLDIYKMRERLAERGLKYVDQRPERNERRLPRRAAPSLSPPPLAQRGRPDLNFMTRFASRHLLRTCPLLCR